MWEIREGGEEAADLGGTTFPLFSKKGRLKTGRHSLRVWLGAEGDTGVPPATPGKPPVADRGQLG